MVGFSGSIPTPSTVEASRDRKEGERSRGQVRGLVPTGSSDAFERLLPQEGQDGEAQGKEQLLLRASFSALC